MAASSSDISNYISNIRYGLSDYGDKLARYSKLGKRGIECMKFKFALLSNYVALIIDYFDTTDYTTNNFFTVTEAETIMNHINNILDSNYWLDLQ